MIKQMRSGKRTKEGGDRLLNRLTAAARNAGPSPGAVADDQWRAGVMREVRRIGPLSKTFRPAVSFGGLAWRLAPAALALIAVMSVVALQAGSAIDNQLVGLAVSDPVDAYVMYIPF